MTLQPTAKPVRRTQEERKAESEQQIINAAIRLIAQQGYIRTTLQQVGEAAGYTAGLVSHRFGSKEGLLKAVVDRMSTRFLNDQLRPGIELPGAEESMRNFIEIYLNNLSAPEDYMRALYVIIGEAIGAVPEIQKEIAWLNERTRNRLSAIIQQGINNGEFEKSVSPSSLSIFILALLRGITIQSLTDEKAIDMKKLIPELQETIQACLKSH